MKRTPINDHTSPIPWLTFEISECGGWRSALYTSCKNNLRRKKDGRRLKGNTKTRRMEW
jgi:hypothetical protein